MTSLVCTPMLSMPNQYPRPCRESEPYIPSTYIIVYARAVQGEVELYLCMNASDGYVLNYIYNYNYALH